jgi:lysozyme family protein
MPWAFVGVIHGMECSFNFAGHLHNGDPLIHRTTHVPKNCPVNGTPPFSWQDSAVDALTLKGLNQETNWSIARMLYLLEKYNGFGYRFKQLPTPYLWSFSNLFSKGKFVADHKFDPEAPSKQCGAAVMLKSLIDRGVSLF